MKRLFNLSALLVLASIFSMSSSYGQSCDTLRNYTVPGDGMYSVWQGGPDGALLSQEILTAGPDTYEVDLWMEPYSIGTVTKQIRAIRFLPSVIENNSGSASFNLVIYNDNSGTPGTQIASQTVAYDDLNDPMFWNTIELTNAVSVTGTFWVGYQLSYAMPWDKFQLAGTTHILNYTTFHLTGFGSLNNTWHAVNDIYSDENNNDIYSAFALDVLLSNGTVPDPNMTGDNISACLSGAFVNLDASGTTGDVDVYEWWLTDDPATQIYTDAYGVNATLNPTTATPSSQRIYLWADGACVTRGVYAVVTVHPDVTATATPTNATCGNNNGSITINATGGSGTYTYSIDGGTTTSSTGTFNNLAAGSYAVEVTTAGNGCNYAETVTITNIPGETISVGSGTTICAGASANLTASGNGTIEWFDGTTPVGTGTTYIANPTSPTTYDVVLTDANGCTDTKQVTVNVDPQDDASFAYSSNTLCLGSPNVTPTISGTQGGVFSASGTGLVIGITTGEIDLSTSTAGTYNVTYSTNGTCPDTETVSITITDSPDASFTYANTEYCSDEGVINPNFGSNGSAGTFSSSTGLSITAGTGSINLGTSTAGTYTITNTIAASGSCSASSETFVVTIKATPTVDAGQDEAICEGESVTLTANTSAGTVTWDNGVTDGQAFTPTSTDTYTVTADNNGCTTTDNVTVTVNPLPTVDAGQDEAVCEGESVTLTANTSAGTVTWDNGVTDGQVFTPTATETYTVTADNGGCTATDNVTITVNALPTVDAGQNEAVCEGESVTLTANTSAGTVTWDNGVTDGQAFTPTTTETYTVTADNNGCTATDNVTVTVNEIPTVDAGQDDAICEGESVTLTANASAGTVTWDNGVTDGQAFTPTATETYTVTADNGGCTATDNVTITVNALPTVDAGQNLEVCVYNAAVTLTGTPAGGTYTGTGVSNNTFDPATAEVGTHTITYTYTDANGCENSATMQIAVDGCASISVNELNNQFVLSPNPSTEFIDVKVLGNNKMNSVQLISLEGKVINTNTTVLDGQVTRVDVSLLSKGTYLIQLSTDNGSITKKVVVQ